VEEQLDIAKTIEESKPSDKKPARSLGKPTPEALRQLSLFQTFYGTATDHEHLSNVIELWDAAPKYVSAGKREAESIHRLDYLEREFEWRGQAFKLLVIPATLICPDGSAYRRFPSAREELVEAALRKLSVQQRLGFVGADENQTILGVKFSLSMLRRELARHGHDIHFDSLLESLMIISRCHVEISLNEPKHKAIRQSSILSSLDGVSRSDWLACPETLWSARFHPMVSQGLAAAAYRQFDYDTMMDYRTALARWLHRHMASDCRNAGIMHPVKISLSFAISNSGLLNHARIRDRAKAMEGAVAELKSADRPAIVTCERHPIILGRTVQDVQYVLYPSMAFIGISNSHYGISNKINMIKMGILHLLRYLPQIMSI
jgi:hypothetical protein